MLQDRGMAITKELLKGAIDIHVHAGPHIKSSPRRVDPLEAAIQAQQAGMQALVFMDVFEMSCGTAWLVNRAVPNFQTFGGLILNTVYNGLNPRAVKTALHYGDGAKFISFGAHSTYYQAAGEGRFVDGKFVPLSELYPEFKTEELDRCIRIPLYDEPSAALDEILKLIACNQHVYLNTGHVSPEEAIRLVELATEYGIKRKLVAGAVTKNANIDQLKKMTNHGAFVEYTLAAYTHTTPIPKTHYYVEPEYISIDEGMEEGPKGGVRTVAEQIKELGADNCIIATDFGVYTLPTPVEGLREFIACLLDLGMNANDIRKLIKQNPERLLGLA